MVHPEAWRTWVSDYAQNLVHTDACVSLGFAFSPCCVGFPCRYVLFEAQCSNMTDRVRLPFGDRWVVSRREFSEFYLEQFSEPTSHAHCLRDLVGSCLLTRWDLYPKFDCRRYAFWFITNFALSLGPVSCWKVKILPRLFCFCLCQTETSPLLVNQWCMPLMPFIVCFDSFKLLWHWLFNIFLWFLCILTWKCWNRLHLFYSNVLPTLNFLNFPQIT